MSGYCQYRKEAIAGRKHNVNRIGTEKEINTRRVIDMPKMKTHRGLAKRVKMTGSGKLKRSHAFTSHRFHGKTKKQRRQLAKSGLINKTDYKRIKLMLIK